MTEEAIDEHLDEEIKYVESKISFLTLKLEKTLRRKEKLLKKKQEASERLLQTSQNSQTSQTSQTSSQKSDDSKEKPRELDTRVEESKASCVGEKVVAVSEIEKTEENRTSAAKTEVESIKVEIQQASYSVEPIVDTTGAYTIKKEEAVKPRCDKGETSQKEEVAETNAKKEDASSSLLNEVSSQKKEEEKQVTVKINEPILTAVNAPNYFFYKGKLRSKPQGDSIHIIHDKWWYDYTKLEYHHGYIQWLFPMLLKNGVNSDAKPMTRVEARQIIKEIDCAFNVLQSYRMMLNFWGFKLVNEATGEVQPNPNLQFAIKRMTNVAHNSHNCLRITRVLTSLGQLGFDRYKKGFLAALHRVVTEPFEGYKKPLWSGFKKTYQDYWSLVCDPTNPKYQEQTMETGPEDREESVIFHHIENETEEWKQFVQWRNALEEEREGIQRMTDAHEVKQHDKNIKKHVAGGKKK